MKKMKRKTIIILIVLFVILFIILGICLNLLKKEKAKKQQLEEIQQKKEQVVQYTKVSDFKTIEEVLLYLDSEFISQQASEEENLDYVVKAKLKYNLNLNNKNYYENLIQYSAAACNYKNFYIIDEEQNIKILVLCSNNKVSSYYINSEKFYFDKLESKENIAKTIEENITKINKTCDLLEELLNNKWVATNIDFGAKESIYNSYDIYFDEGLEIKKINGQIYNIIFNEKFTQDVIENLKVGSNNEDIKEALGNPNFETSKIIGYKSENFYVFFSQNQISVYPTIDYSTDEIMQLIENYEKTQDFKTYINELRRIWEDYDIFTTSNNKVILQYTLKGIVFKYDNTSKQGIVLYNNYKGKIDKEHSLEDVAQKIVDIPENMNFVNEDLVFEEEIKRINSLDDYSGKDNFANTKVLNISTKFKAYTNVNSNKFCFISINKQVPNSELKEAFDSGIWYEDNKFIYSVEGKGIYIYNAEERKYTTLINGTEKFEIKKIENNKLYYDEKIVDL